MRAAVELAGYTPSESDELRKAISKKNKQDIDKHRNKFVTGAVKQGMEQSVAESIYSDWEEFARYGFNKCLPGDVEIIDPATGRLVTIEDLYHGRAQISHTLSCEISSLKLANQPVTRVMNNGIKPVFRLTTALGRVIEATDNHPFYTYHGWRQLGELQIDEFIAVPRVIPVEGKNEWHDQEAIALGHLLAEGNLCHPHSVYFYSQDIDQVNDFVQAANSFENVNCTIATHKSTYSVYAARTDKRNPPEIFTWMGELGLLGKNARTKEIPASVFELNNRQIGLMISRMWEGDGHIDVRGHSLFYATASKKMASQLQHLLLRFGIISRIRTVEFPYKEGRVGYQVFVTGYKNISSFGETIGCHFVSQKRIQALTTLLDSLPTSVAIGTKDIIPVSAAKEYVRSAKENAGVTWAELSRAIGIAPREFYPTNSAGKIGFGRNTLQRLGDYFDDENIKRLAESDVYWDRVTYIEYVGEKQTYDLEIADTHNFIANDILVHNSHAADYGVIAVQTAYLKAHYPAEYMTALLSASASQIEKVAYYVSDARSMGVPVLPIDINASGWDFQIEDVPAEDGGSSKKPSIRFGIGAVKNVGQAAVETILNERDQNGKYKDLNDFARRADLRAVGKRALECLIKVGAMDSFGNRAALLASLDRIVAISAAHFRAADAGQMSLFGANTGVVEEITLPEVNNVDKREMLNWERELIGLYISDHPLTPYQKTFAQIVSYFSGQLPEAAHEEKVRVAGLITNVRPYMTKTNKPMGFVTLEDIQGNIELVLFPRTWEKTREQLTVGQIVIVEGKVDSNSTPPKILVDTVRTEIKILESLDETPLHPQGKSGSIQQATPQPKPTLVTPLNIKSTQPKPMALKPALQVAESSPAYPVERDAIPPVAVERDNIPLHDAHDDDMPPPPDNFPDGWDNEWQPSFDERALAFKPEPKFKKSEEVTPPRELASTLSGGTGGGSAQVEIHDEEPSQDDPAREAIVTSLKSIYTTLVKEEDQKHPPKQITVMLRSTGDKERDRRRIKTMYGTLISFHGRDRFSFQIFENGSGHLIDFPNDTTRVCPEMLERLKKLIGEESWRVEEITFQ